MKKACGNCGHLTRTGNRDNTRCGIDGSSIGYMEFFERRCERWTKQDKEEQPC